MAQYKEFVVSGDCHIIEPVDLFKTRLPANMRDRALWEEEFTLDEPIVPGRPHRVQEAAHHRLRRLDGVEVPPVQGPTAPTPDGSPTDILRDMDMEASTPPCMFPNLSLFVLFTDDHELSMAHARVVQRLGRRDATCRTRTGCARRGDPADRHRRTRWPRSSGRSSSACGRILLPEIPPVPYWSREYEPVWAAAEAHGLPIFIHVATGGVKVKDDASHDRRARSRA